MKANLPLICALASFAGAYGGYRLAGFTSPVSDQGDLISEVEPALEPATGGTDHEGEMGLAVRSLEREIAELRSQLMHLEVNRARTALPTEDQPAEAASPTSRPLPTADERARILTVMSEEQERLAHEKELARAKKLQEEVERRASEIADELSLPTGSEIKIASIYLEERTRVEALMETQRESGRSKKNREVFNQQLLAVREWRNNELTALFGVHAAKTLSRVGDKASKKVVNYKLEAPRSKNEGSKKKSKKGGGAQ